MKSIGLTGNIGTGKSTVARIFEILNVPVYHADLQARKLLDREDVKEQILRFFGRDILNKNNEIDRKALAAIVFVNTQKLAQLNALIHPLIEADFMKWCLFHQSADYVVHEAAILFESNFQRLFDATILVIAPEELCISRVMARDGISKDIVLTRLQHQWSQDEKLKLADYKIINDETEMVLPQVLSLHKQFSVK